jgi:hypothetical protein
MGRWSDQRHMERLRNASATALARVQEDVGPTAHRLADRFFQAVDLQLTSDFRYREAERVEALQLESPRAQAARRTADRYNDACLEVLTEEMPSAIQQVRDQFGGRSLDIRDSLAIMEQEGREQLADMDLKGEDAAEAGRILSETVAFANENGIDGLCDRLADQASQFATLRRRRPEHNSLAVTITGAMFCGVAATILAICWASTPGGCRNPTVLGIVTVLFAIGAFILLTELLAYAAA